MPVEFSVAPEQKGQRLDRLLAVLPGLNLSRSQAKRLIENKFITVNGRPVEPSYKTKAADLIKVIISPAIEPTAKPEMIPLEIVYEDDDIIVVNKPKGMVTHPAPGNYSGTLVNALLYQTKLSSIGAPLRPGIVHRLDKDTSGLIVAAKTDAAYKSLAKQIKDRTVEKTYLALVHGLMKNNEGQIEAKIGRHPVNRKKMAVLESQKEKSKSKKSRDALTYYKVLKRFKNYSLVEVKIKTGRTHQIRVHLAHLGHPVVGDSTYGKKKNEFGVTGQLLHAQKIKLLHPITGKAVGFEAAIPKAFKDIIRVFA